MATTVTAAVLAHTSGDVKWRCTHRDPADDSAQTVALQSNAYMYEGAITANATLNVVNFCERSPHYFKSAEMTRCRIMDICRREWSALQRTDQPVAPAGAFPSTDIPIGYTVDPVSNHTDYSAVQCYFGTLDVHRNASRCPVLPVSSQKRFPQSSVDAREWGVFYVSSLADSDMLEETNLDAILSMWVAALVGVCVVIMVMCIETEHVKKCGRCCGNLMWGAVRPLNLTDHRTPQRKYLAAVAVMGMFVLREGLDTAYGVDGMFAYDPQAGFQVIAIFAGVPPRSLPCCVPSAADDCCLIERQVCLRFFQ